MHKTLSRFITKLSLAMFIIAVFVVLAHESEFFCPKAYACEETIPTTTSAELAANYFTYNDQKLQELLASNSQVVLYFHANWCVTCSDFDRELQDSGNTLPSNTTVLKIDYDTHKALRQKYQVVYQHTLVLLDKQGNIKESWIGGDLQALHSYLKLAQ